MYEVKSIAELEFRATIGESCGSVMSHNVKGLLLFH